MKIAEGGKGVSGKWFNLLGNMIVTEGRAGSLLGINRRVANAPSSSEQLVLTTEIYIHYKRNGMTEIFYSLFPG